MNETQILSDFHNMLLKEIEALKSREPNLNVKRLSFLARRFPFHFPYILDACFNVLIDNAFGQFLA